MDSAKLKEMAHCFGADLIGISPISRFEGVKKENDPRNIFPHGKNMIVLGRRILRGSLRGVETGSALNGSYSEFGLYMLEDQFLAKTTYDLVIWMEKQGFEAVPMFGYDPESAAGFPLGAPVEEGKVAPNVYVDWKLAAHLCGLGQVGRNGLFITPEFGTLQRFSMLITDADLEADEVLDRQVCEGCNACISACPLNENMCKHCSTGALQTDFGRFHSVDKIAAACGRACLASLEKRGLITRKFNTPFRSETPEAVNRNEVK